MANTRPNTQALAQYLKDAHALKATSAIIGFYGDVINVTNEKRTHGARIVIDYLEKTVKIQEQAAFATHGAAFPVSNMQELEALLKHFNVI